jgi:glycosyltransferase involved in cell wall biosynthesis
MTSSSQILSGSRPRVTCAIIFLDEERFVGEAMDSVLAQTFSDWELLLVDDGSSDASVGLAQDLAKRQPDRVRYLCHDRRANRGKSASRNLALKEARGEFIAYLDGDDVWLADKLERQVAIFDRYPQAHLVCGATEYWRSWCGSDADGDQLRWTGEVDGKPTLEEDRLYPPGSLLRHFYPIGRGLTPSQSGYIIRRQFAVALGGFEDRFRSLFEDLLFITKAVVNGSVIVSNHCFDRYRQHPNSSSSRATRAEWLAAKKLYLEWLRDYLRDRGMNDPRTARRLRRELLRCRFPTLYQVGGRLTRRIRRLTNLRRSASGAEDP